MKKNLTLLIIFSGLSFFCKKDNSGGIPNVAVNIYIYTTDPSFVNLNVIGGWVYITGGVKGIVVYRKNNDEFMAYERNCTYKPELSCARINVDASNIMAEDTCCGSKFVLTDGSVVNGPASFPLKKYQTKYEGNSLHIYN